MAVNPRSIDNLKVIRDSERARELAQLSAQARRRNKEEREKQAALTLAAISYGTLVKAQIEPDVPWTSRIQAAIASLNREEGMPTQRTEHVQLEDRPLAELSQEELLERARQAGLPVLGEHVSPAIHEASAASIPNEQSETP